MVLAVLASGLVTVPLITDYKNLGTLTRVISLVNKYYLEPTNVADMVNGAARGIVESLNDPYSVYMPPKMNQELRDQVRGSFGGIGILVGPGQEHLTVVKPIRDTPAYKAGLKAGDLIFKIEGKDTKGMDLDSAVNLMRGPVGTAVAITVYRGSDKKMHDYKLTREIIKVPTVEGKMLPGTDIAYISIVQFTSNTYTEMEKTLHELGIPLNDPAKSKAKGIILDLRGNPGGELESAVNIANLFVPEGPIVFIDYRSDDEEVYRADKSYVNLPLLVLVDEYSASASEILAGAIKDTKAGTLIGNKTFGKGVVQSLYELQNNAGLKLTTGKYLTPQRHDINKKGIQPDIKVDLPQNATKDTQLDKAIEVMKERIK